MKNLASFRARCRRLWFEITELDAGIPPISLPLVRLQDPLVSLQTGRRPCALGIIDSEDMQSLRLLLFD